MKAKPYPKMKPSGVEWLGDVPDHWGVAPLKFVCRFAYGDSLAAEDREDGGFYVYGSNGPVGTHIKHNTLSPVIVIGRKGSYGKINYSDNPVFSIDTTYFIDNRFTANALQWLKYALLPLKLDEGSKDSAVPGLAREDAYINKFPLPPLHEQQAIASFLDRRTADIDYLISKKQSLTEKLKEKRTALISQTVTRGLPPEEAKKAGLNPHPKMKPSGVEWLGDVPEHWEVKKLKYVCHSITGFAFSSDDYVDDGIPLIRIGDILQNGEVDIDNTKKLPSDYLQLYPFVSISKDDILMAMTGATIGKAGKYQFNEVGLLNQRVCKFVPFEINNNYLWHVLKSGAYVEHIKLTGFGGAQPNISDIQLLDFHTAKPPFTEQQAIASFLDHETAKIDSMIAKVESAIEKLQEYRTALITAAVTGKIDLREAVA